jgi:GH24 family phage-related lysozyme (muramidase)
MAEYVPAPSYPNYSAFLTNLGQNLGENLSRQEPRQIAIDRQRLALQQDQMQIAQQKAIQDAFRGGVPMTNGVFDPRAAMSIFAGAGDVPDALAMAQATQVQQQNQQAMNYQHPFAGGAAPPATPFTGPPASAATGASTKAPGATGGTVSELVASALPATPAVASVATNIARAVTGGKGDLNTPLNDEQAAQARKLLDAYSKRQGVKQSAQSGALPTFATGGADAMISHFEGFRPTPYWDVNHWRVGYGSDTITKPDGSVETVTKSTQVSPEDAKRDLQRRIGESQSAISSKIGADNWNRLTPGAQSALTSVAYNYGSVPAKVLAAAKTGDPQRIASAIAALPANPGRRLQEANAVVGKFGLGGPEATTGPAQTYAMPAGAQTGPLSGAVLPQIAPMQMGGQAAIPPPEAIQAAQGGDQAPAPLAAPGVEPQQAAAPAPQAPAYHGYPLPEGYNNPVDAIKGLTEDINFLSRNPSPVAKARVKELEYERGQIAKEVEKNATSGRPIHIGNDKNGDPVFATYDATKRTFNKVDNPAAGSRGEETGATLDMDASRYLETGTLPPNMGRGVQGAAQATAIRERAAEMAKEQGIDPATLAQRQAQFKAQHGFLGSVDAIAKGIMDGDRPPELSRLYGLSAPVSQKLEENGFNMSKAELEWKRAQKMVQSLNGPQTVRFVGLANSVTNTIDNVRDLAKKMDLSGIPALNQAQIATYIQAQGNTPNGQLAAQYLAGVNTLKEEFANLATGGYAPTEATWKLANTQINSNYGVKELGASLDEIQRLIKYRLNAMPGLAEYGPGVGNQYLPGGGAQPGAPASAAPPASAPIADGWSVRVK